MVTDHLGNTFKTLVEMCKYYNISTSNYNDRINRGWSQKDALTTKPKNGVTDPLGNHFTNIPEMCKHHGISISKYYRRLKSGMSMLEALNEPSYVTDHEGRKFANYTELCKFHNLNYSVFHARITRGESIEKAITTPSTDLSITDPYGQTFSSKAELCRYYNVIPEDYRRYKNHGYSLQEYLKIIPKIGPHIKNKQITKDLCILNAILPVHKRAVEDVRNIYFECTYKNRHVILKHDDILKTIDMKPIAM